MTFNRWRNDIMADAIAFGSSNAGVKMSGDPTKHDRYLAAAATVIAHLGQEWCSQNPEAFGNKVLETLSGWLKILGPILKIIGFANPYVAIAAWLLPVIVEWLSRNSSAVACGAAEPINWLRLAEQGKKQAAL